MTDLQHELLSTCFDRFEGTLASGRRANNKLYCERISDNPELEALVVKGLARAVSAHNPEFVVGVPSGATKLADKVAAECEIYSVFLDKDEDGNMDFKTSVDKEAICMPLHRGVLIDDVLNWFTRTKQALQIPELGQRIVAVEAIIDRGNDNKRASLPVPHSALLKVDIPEELPEDSPLWRYASQ
jgi:orotate phosphoribosyltransferase